MARSWRQLVEGHLWLVDVEACKFVVDAMDREELRSVGFEALVLAALKYQPGPATFHTYARRCVRGYMLNWLAMPPMEVVDVSTLTVLSPPASMVDDRWQYVVDWSVVEPVAELVLWCLFYVGFTYVETARELGLTVRDVRTIEADALKVLKITML